MFAPGMLSDGAPEMARGYEKLKSELQEIGYRLVVEDLKIDGDVPAYEQEAPLRNMQTMMETMTGGEGMAIFAIYSNTEKDASAVLKTKTFNELQGFTIGLKKFVAAKRAGRIKVQG